MSNYTAQEVQDAVEKIVRSSVRHPTGILGDRNISVSFSDIQEAAAGVYILWFNAPFYTLLLGTRRLQDLADSQVSTISSLIDAIYATDRLVTPVKDVSPLANARSALEELETAVAQRKDGFADIEKVPAYRRYVQNLDGFLGTVGPNIKAPLLGTVGGSAIVDTPSGARAKIPSLVRQLVDQHQELISKAKLLAGALEDFASLNLPRVAAQGVISRAREVLDQHLSELSALDENARLESLRSVALDLLTQKPLVKKFGAAQAPSEFIITSGLASAFADAEHPATPASIMATKPGPYPILATDQFITFTMDGGAPFNFPLPLGFIAELRGILQEPFNITSDRNALRIVFGDLDTGTPTFNVALTLGAARTAEQVAAEINAVVGATALRAEEIFFPLKYTAPVTITPLVGSNARFTILAGNLVSMGVVVGDEVDVLDGLNAPSTWVITAVDAGGQFVDALGPGPAFAQPLPGAMVEMGPAARALRLIDTDEAGSLSVRRSIRLERTGGEEDLTVSILGFFPGAQARSRPVAASAVASNINASTSKLRAAAMFTGFPLMARSEPSDPTRIVFAQLAGTGICGAGTTVLLNSALVKDTTVDVGDKLIIRGSSTLADVGIEGEITSVADGACNVLFPTAVVGGLITFEVGPDIEFGFGDVINITAGSNTGRYVIGETQGVRTSASFEAVLEGVLPVPNDGDLPLYFTAELGVEHVLFQSRDTTLATKVQVGGLGGGYFFSALPIDNIGTTPWLRFAEFPTGVSIGDIVQLYETQYNVPNRLFVIQSLDSDVQALELDGEVDVDFSLSFDLGVPNPFGRIRIAQVANYSELKERIDAWLARPEQQSLYFSNLARLLNPIVTNANPTVSMVNDATNHLKKLLSVLSEDGSVAFGQLSTPAVTAESTLEFALDEYEAPAVEPVDVLLSTFRQKGADRAIDLLVEGQFSTFFNLDVDGVSYSGTLMKGLRELAREDLPIRKFNRRATGGEKLIGSVPDQTDFEFSSEDADDPNQPDIPASPDVSSPGENY